MRLFGRKKKVEKDPQQLLYEKWFADGGPTELRHAYPLNEESVVVDLGGYRGNWADEIFSRYRCSIHIFEPVADFADQIDKRFAANEKITLHRFGIGSKTSKGVVSFQEEGTSLFREGVRQRSIEIKEANAILEKLSLPHIDLMKVNIEGGEYDLLPYLIKTGWIEKIDNLQIQFHQDYPGAEEVMEEIQEALSRTHELTYQYRFIFENWKKRDANKNCRS